MTNFLEDYKKWEAEARAPYMPMDDMKPYYLYRVHCRNSRYGLWLPDQNGCMGRRQKFHDWFLFTEYHYDTGPPYGTLKPMRELEKSPFGPKDFEMKTFKGKYGEYMKEASYTEMFKYLEEKEREYDEKDG